MKGTVVRKPEGKNFAFARGEDGVDYFFHAGLLKNATMKEISVGMTIKFTASHSPKGARAVDVMVN